MDASVADLIVTDGGEVPISVVTAAGLADWLTTQEARTQNWVRASGFSAKTNTHCLIPGDDGGLARVIAGLGDDADFWAFGALGRQLPRQRYVYDGRIGDQPDPAFATRAAIAWALGQYRFQRYKSGNDNETSVLQVPAGADAALARRLAGAVSLIRDLINTPASDMGPDDLAQAASDVAARAKATIEVIRGDALLDRNFPTIHAVGRASSRPPCLIDMRWGDADAAKVTLVGKGVCFDSGGLDLKSADGMRLMKKDMGGAAHVLGIGQAVMDAGLPVRLRILIPAVENAVSGDAFRPGDVVTTRSGRTVEIGNTDAEGRLVLCDALTEADSESPKIIIDMATLTGAARVALGTDLPALFTDDDALAGDLLRHAGIEADPLWRLPLWHDYRPQLDSAIADINNIGGRFAGAITAALYLNEFVDNTKAWAHFDVMAWNLADRPGRPVGGEALAVRTIYAMLAERFSA